MNWKPITEAEIPEWMALANELLADRYFHPLCCPACAAELRIFLHRRGSGSRGGLWLWCTACGRHYHSSCLVPEWGHDVIGIPSDRLADPPDYLEANWHTISNVINSKGEPL